MERRNFFKIISTVSAGLATNACGSKSNQLIPLLVPAHEIVPGEEQWHATVCRECSAGCGVLARVMAGERVVEREGKKFRERIACIKKLEGNPEDKVSAGGMCARGHAALQGLYNPDRLRGPMLRTGDRGRAGFKQVSWDEALSAAAEKLSKARAEGTGKILCLTRPESSERASTLAAFLQAIGAPVPRTSGFDSFALERKAAEMVFGAPGLPVYDIANARYVLGIGADFLGSWISPVEYTRQFGQLRQGRPDIRGKLVQAESRMSITASSADEWLPLRPGSEPQFALALLKILIADKGGRGADKLPAATRESIEAANLPDLIKATGLDEKRLTRIAKELFTSEGPMVVAGASTVRRNTLDGMVAAHYLNVALGKSPKFAPAAIEHVGNSLAQARVLLLDNENPIYTMPGTKQAIAGMNSIISFSSFLDDSSAYADVILPGHHWLEDESVGVLPLYNTRSLKQVLTDLAAKLNTTIPPAAQPPAAPEAKPAANIALQTRASEAMAADQFPFEFQPYLSLQFHDGRGANLPWMQELPDPSSSAMWDLPVELDPKSAAKLNVENGDRVRVTSQHGSVEAWAYVNPAALPGVINMAIGQGHQQFGRYASNRGANPLTILAPAFDSATGVPLTGGTRVRLERIAAANGELIQFSPRDREQGPWGRG